MICATTAGTASLTISFPTGSRPRSSPFPFKAIVPLLYHKPPPKSKRVRSLSKQSRYPFLRRSALPLILVAHPFSAIFSTLPSPRPPQLPKKLEIFVFFPLTRTNVCVIIWSKSKKEGRTGDFLPKGDYERKRTGDGGAAVLSQLRAQDYGVQRGGRGSPDGMPEVSGRFVQQAERGERDRHQNESGGFRRNVSEFAREHRVVLKQRTGKSRESLPCG